MPNTPKMRRAIHRRDKPANRPERGRTAAEVPDYPAAAEAETEPRGFAERPPDRTAVAPASPDPIVAVGTMLGGGAILGRPIATALDLATVIQDGIPTRAVRLLWKKKVVSPAELYARVVPRRTFEHRERAGRLTPEQSDRLARVLRIVALAERSFGDAARAAHWLRRKTRPLDGLTPLELLGSDAGAKAVEELLGRIEHGIAA